MESVMDFVRAVGEEALVVYSAYGMIVVGFAVLLTLLGFFSAPYGRYAESSSNSFLSGVKLPARACWVLMESPALVITAIFYRYGLITTGGLVTKMLYFYFLAHYVHRSLIFPFRMKAGAPMPLFIMLSALFYCTWNALMQAAFFLRVASYGYVLINTNRPPNLILLILLVMIGCTTHGSCSDLLYFYSGWRRTYSPTTY